MKNRTAAQLGQFQLFPRMRIPAEMLSAASQLHVIEAIRRNPGVDKDGIYTKALQDIASGRNAVAFDRVRKCIDGLMANPKAKRNRKRLLADSRWLNHDEDAYPNIVEFNRRFLNDRGLFALLMVLFLDATNLDLEAIDTFRGRDAVTAAYGKRQTQEQKRLGKELQLLLKQFETLDEPAAKGAADCYVEYRFLHHGNFPGYKRRVEQEEAARHEEYYRTWFRRFDEALGYPPAPRGRPRN